MYIYKYLLTHTHVNTIWIFNDFHSQCPSVCSIFFHVGTGSQAIEALLGPRRPGEAQVESARSRVKVWKWRFSGGISKGLRDTHVFIISQNRSVANNHESDDFFGEGQHVNKIPFVFWLRLFVKSLQAAGEAVDKMLTQDAFGAQQFFGFQETSWKTIDLWISNLSWWHSLFTHFPLRKVVDLVFFWR